MSRTFGRFEEFVGERWPDLEGVAFVVTLDPVAARLVTTAALAGLHQHWREALDEGRPVLMARRAVLSAVVAGSLTRGRNGSLATGGTSFVPYRPGADPLTGSGELPDGDDAVRTALEVVVRAATPLERALVGAASVWGQGPDEVADLLMMPPADVRERAATLRARLASAHEAARSALGRDGWNRAWDLDLDVDVVVDRLLTGLPDPPDPATLGVEHRAVRRRILVAAGAAMAVAGAAGWWVWPHHPTASGGRRPRGTPPTG